MPHDRARAVRRVTLVVALLAALSVFAFMTVGVRGSWGFVLAHRGIRLAALVTVAYAIAPVDGAVPDADRQPHPDAGGDGVRCAVPAVANRAGGGAWRCRGQCARPRGLLFSAECLVMVGLSGLLFRLLFRGEGRNLPLVVLAGLLFGALFRSLASFLQRIMDPNDFLVLQGRAFASFQHGHRPGIDRCRGPFFGTGGRRRFCCRAFRNSTCWSSAEKRQPVSGSTRPDFRRSSSRWSPFWYRPPPPWSARPPSSACWSPTSPISWCPRPGTPTCCPSPLASPSSRWSAARCCSSGCSASAPRLSIIIDFVGGVAFLLILFRTGRR